jgi:hypothetical protein
MKAFLILAFALILGGQVLAKGSGDFHVKKIAIAQDSPLPVHFTESKNFNVLIRQLASANGYGSTGVYIPDITKVNARALKDFQNRFSDVGGAKWFSDENGYYSYFNKDGFNDRAFYNKNGRWLYSLIYKTEDKLPEDLRATIKSVYFDWTINVIEEIRTNDGVVYVVYLEDKSNFRVLKVSAENEIETIVNLIKQ